MPKAVVLAAAFVAAFAVTYMLRRIADVLDAVDTAEYSE